MVVDGDHHQEGRRFHTRVVCVGEPSSPTCLYVQCSVAASQKPASTAVAAQVGSLQLQVDQLKGQCETLEQVSSKTHTHTHTSSHGCTHKDTH